MMNLPKVPIASDYARVGHSFADYEQAREECHRTLSNFDTSNMSTYKKHKVEQRTKGLAQAMRMTDKNYQALVAKHQRRDDAIAVAAIRARAQASNTAMSTVVQIAKESNTSVVSLDHQAGQSYRSFHPLTGENASNGSQGDASDRDDSHEREEVHGAQLVAAAELREGEPGRNSAKRAANDEYDSDEGNDFHGAQLVAAPDFSEGEPRRRSRELERDDWSGAAEAIEYVEMLKKLKASRDGVQQQEARHLTLLANRWSLFDAAKMGAAFRMPQCPAVVHLSRKIHAVLAAMPGLDHLRMALAAIPGNSGLVVPKRWSFWPFATAACTLNADVIVATMTALALDLTTASTTRVEGTSKMLVSHIIGDAVALTAPGLQVRCEFSHEFAESSAAGSGWSDLSITATSRREAMATLVCEAAAARSPVHKDFEVAPAEAAFESCKVVRYIANAEDLPRAGVYFALIGDTRVEFGLVTPTVLSDGSLVFLLDRRGPLFDLRVGMLACRLAEALRLAAYVVHVIVPHGQRMQQFLAEQTTILPGIRMPRIEKTAPKSSASKAALSPQKKHRLQ
ncbi:hypothetical protein HDU86_003284 [Geranomyces michiganensis]|nr:hypothetical protein HDU86_003284 [Geranomyces michiganensis]